MEDSASVASSSSVQLLTKPQFDSACRDAMNSAAHSGPGEVMVLFSSSRGQSSYEDPAACNGRFTSCLIRHLAQPGVTIDMIYKNANRDMYKALRLKPTAKQQPWQVGSLRHDLVLQHK